MNLKSKTCLALGLAFLAAMAGLLPSYLALTVAEAHFAALNIAATTDADAAVAQELHSQLRLGRLSMAPGAASVFLVLAALALLAQRQIIAPLRSITTALKRIGSGDFAPPEIQNSTDEIGRLSRAVSQMAAELKQVIQDRISEERTLAETAARYRDLAHLAADFVWETDTAGRVTYFSGVLDGSVNTQMLLGHPLDVLMSVAVPGDETRALELTSRRPLENLLCRYETDIGDPRYCRLSGQAKLDASGAFHGYRGIGQDVTDEILTEKRAHASAFLDPLTGLANKTLIEERIDQALSARSLSKGDVAVIHIDLDRFKDVNDAFGHAVGDAVLKDVAERLTALVGPQDTVARVDGDGFVVVQANAAQPEAAEHLCLSLLKSLRQPIRLQDHSVTLTASLGCALASSEEDQALTLLRNADIAMYRAKDDGRDTYRFHERAMTAALQARMAMERDLRLAIEKNAIDIHYQPIIHAASGGLAGFETRLRWPRSGHGMVYPEDFLPLAEDTGLIVPLSANTLTSACRTAMSWPNLTVAVDLSPASFLHDGLLGTVVRALRDSNLSVRQLELEITESALLGSEDTAMFQFDALRELGVRLVLDEFGSGTSSLQLLQRFPFDRLKLHRRCVAGIDTDQAMAEIVGSVLQLGAALEMETSADGVANAEQAKRLTELGCKTLQGPHFGKALTANRAFARVRSDGILPGAPKVETLP